MKSFRMLAAIAALALCPAAQARDPLVDPPKIAVPEGVSPAKVEQAIKNALIGRTWVPTKIVPGRIDAALDIRAHQATITIGYDEREVDIDYVSSVNLDYKVNRRGKVLIHENYNGWIEYLVNDIARHLEAAALD